jgi:hypothetical protein
MREAPSRRWKAAGKSTIPFSALVVYPSTAEQAGNNRETVDVRTEIKDN